MTFFVTAQTAFHHCTFSFITAHFVHHCAFCASLHCILCCKKQHATVSDIFLRFRDPQMTTSHNNDDIESISVCEGLAQGHHAVPFSVEPQPRHTLVMGQVLGVSTGARCCPITLTVKLRMGTRGNAV